jgi:hypothetical protein
MKGFLDRVLLPGFAFKKRERSLFWAGQSHVSSMNNLRVASQLQSYPSHIAYVYLELHL